MTGKYRCLLKLCARREMRALDGCQRRCESSPRYVFLQFLRDVDASKRRIDESVPVISDDEVVAARVDDVSRQSVVEMAWMGPGQSD